jgi:hypothetical protein
MCGLFAVGGWLVRRPPMKKALTFLSLNFCLSAPVGIVAVALILLGFALDAGIEALFAFQLPIEG